MLNLYLEQAELARLQGNADAALSILRTAVQMAPKNPFVLRALGSLLEDLDQYDESLKVYNRAIACSAPNPDLFNERGAVFRRLGRYDDAILDYSAALKIDADNPVVKYNFALALLSLGEFKKGFEFYESRWDGVMRKFRREFGVPQWRGDFSINGRRILLHAEQGYGDTFQFLRYVSNVADAGAYVILAVDSSLRQLAMSVEGVSEVICKGDSSVPVFDCHCPLMSLPFCFKTTLDSIPAPVQYLQPPQDMCLKWAEKLGRVKKFRVGLVWSGSREHRNDRQRSAPLRAFEEILKLKGSEFLCLQVDVRQSDRAFLYSSGILWFDNELASFDETAALISNLDMVISVDTAVAHLAGAMGKQVWLLLPKVADWRWLRNRSDSPWYPTMRLFRQATPGNWRTIMRIVAGELAKQIEARQSYT